jgi:hypothetical protein
MDGCTQSLSLLSTVEEKPVIPNLLESKSEAGKIGCP